MFDVVFVDAWPFWAAGLAIGLFVPVFAAVTGRALGISSGYAEACALAAPAGPGRWKLWFALGLPLGGLIANLADGGFQTTTSVAALGAMGVAPAAQLVLFAAGGALIGYGARVAGGCTSGHSIVGIALGAKSSLIATIGFMVGGFAATAAFVWGLGLVGGAR